MCSYLIQSLTHIYCYRNFNKKKLFDHIDLEFSVFETGSIRYDSVTFTLYSVSYYTCTYIVPYTFNVNKTQNKKNKNNRKTDY